MVINRNRFEGPIVLVLDQIGNLGGEIRSATKSLDLGMCEAFEQDGTHL